VARDTVKLEPQKGQEIGVDEILNQEWRSKRDVLYIGVWVTIADCRKTSKIHKSKRHD
jgi:hypothetical protein